MDEHGTTLDCADCRSRTVRGDGVWLRLSATVDRFFCAICARVRLERRNPRYPVFSPLSFPDADGRPRRFEFEFTIDLTPSDRLEILAYEPGKNRLGYEFAIAANADADPIELFRSLHQRIRRGLARRHLEVRNGSLEIRREGIVRARIDQDHERDDGLPAIVIDGRPVKWETFGKMLMEFVGSDFSLEIHDMAEERGDDPHGVGRLLSWKMPSGKPN